VISHTATLHSSWCGNAADQRCDALMRRVLQQSFENQPPGEGVYEAAVSPVSSDGQDAQQAPPEPFMVSVEMTVMGQALLRSVGGSDWPPWAAQLRMLRLTF